MRKRNSGSELGSVTNRHTSRFGNDANPADFLEIPQVSLGQSCPRHCPYREHAASSEGIAGEALVIEDVALLLGCSPWTVRQKYLKQGLPYLRTSPTGRFVFFRKQVLDWILERQEKGGMK